MTGPLSTQRTSPKEPIPSGPWSERIPRTSPSYDPNAPKVVVDPDLQSAYDALVSMLRDYGLESLAATVLDFLQDGYTQDQVSVLLQDTEPYKKRFAGNEQRRAAGLAVLSPAEYLAVEASYRQVMSSAGLPVGFYDQPSDFADWIGKDVSASEVSGRVGFALDAANRLDSQTIQTFSDWYGIGPNDLAAFFLDQDRAMPLIRKIATGVRIKDQAMSAGLALDKAEAERLGGLVGDRDVDSLASQYVEAAKLGEILSDRFGGDDYRQGDAAAEVFEDDAEARKRRKGLADKEESTFSGTSGIGRSTLAKPKNY